MPWFTFEHLYHTTTILNEKSVDGLTDLGEYEYHAEWGKFPTDLEAGKFFTVTPRCDYHDDHPIINPRTGGTEIWDQIFLKYKLKRNVNLYNNLGRAFGHPSEQEMKGYNGFFGQEDCIEIFLKNPEEVLEPVFEKIEFSPRKDKCTGENCPYFLQDKIIV